MAISVDWATGVITVNQIDCVLVSGTLYKLDTNVFRLALKALEASLEGMAFVDTHIHNTEVTVGGITYARTIEVVAPYSVQFLPNTAWSVRLEGSNNNLWDIEAGILVQNQVQVIPTNSGGLIVNQGQSLTAQDLIDIAAANWGALTLGNDTPDTFGGEIVLKKDLNAELDTTTLAPTTVILLEGSTVAGTSANVALRDGVTWEIAEDTLTGLDVEFQFTVADPAQLATTFDVFGKYSGTPAPHYQELWAWNVVALAWEQLHEVFLEDSADFMEASHSFSEVHINRSTGLVRMRMVHNVTNYNAGHRLELDSVTLEVHIPLTLARIANAVWNHVKALTLPKWLGLR